MLTLLLFSACWSDDAPPAGGGGGGGSADARPTRPPDEVGKHKKGGKASKRPRRAERDPQAKIPARGKFDPLEGITKKEWCHEEILMLLKFPIEELESSKGPRQDCCEQFDDLRDNCNMDWPWNDVPSCDEWQWYGAAVKARYGFPFDEQKWKREFGNEAYYTRRDDFDDSWLSAEARLNLQRIANYETAEHKCTP